jgi:hypothetical protein
MTVAGAIPPRAEPGRADTANCGHSAFILEMTQAPANSLAVVRFT